MKHKTGQWVIVTKHRLDGPDLELKGKIVAATPDYAVAECFTPNGPMRFTLSEDTQTIVSFRRAKNSDFRRR